MWLCRLELLYRASYFTHTYILIVGKIEITYISCLLALAIIHSGNSTGQCTVENRQFILSALPCLFHYCVTISEFSFRDVSMLYNRLFYINIPSFFYHLHRSRSLLIPFYNSDAWLHVFLVRKCSPVGT